MTATNHLLHGSIPTEVEPSESIGQWYRTRHGETITDITTDRGKLIFDPPNMLFLYGHRVRIRRYDTDSPVLDVEEFSGDIRTFRLILAAA